MKTFLAWLIANIVGIADVLIIIVYEILLFKGSIPLPEGVGQTSMALGGGLLILFLHGLCIGGYPSKSLIGDIFNLVLLGIGYVAAFSLKDNPEYAFLSAYAWSVIPALILGILAAAFTANNMYEVVSRRMLYIHSSANLFEVKMLYTFNRFVAVFSTGSFIALAVALWKQFTV